MATVSITVPDSLVPQAVATFKVMWPDLVGQSDAAVGRAGVARCIQRVLLEQKTTEYEATQETQKDAYVNSVITSLSGIA